MEIFELSVLNMTLAQALPSSFLLSPLRYQAEEACPHWWKNHF
jgi:hypothetical protein